MTLLVYNASQQDLQRGHGMSPPQFLEGLLRMGCQMASPGLQFGQQLAFMQPIWMLESGQYGVLPQSVIPQPFSFVGPQGPTISPVRASWNKYTPVSPHKMEVNNEMLLCLMMVETSESARRQTYTGHLADAPKTGKKGKEKAREPL